MNTTILIDKKNAKMVAHRGVSGLEAENTCAAFVAAGNRSYYGIETDVHVTADGQFVVIHDNHTGRVSDTDICVEESTRAELAELSLYSNVKTQAPTRQDLVIPDLADYIRICQFYGKIPVLELKNRIETEDIRRMVDQIRQLGYLEETLFISFCWENMTDLREMLPNQKLQFLVSFWDDGLPQKLKEHNLDLDIRYIELTEERVDLLHEMGIEINAWTVDTQDNAEKLARWGVDYITSNILE